MAELGRGVSTRPLMTITETTQFGHRAGGRKTAHTSLPSPTANGEESGCAMCGMLITARPKLGNASETAKHIRTARHKARKGKIEGGQGQIDRADEILTRSSSCA